MTSRARRRILPGFPLAIAITAASILLFVIVPLSTVLATTAQLSPSHFFAVAFDPRARAAYSLSFGASFVAAGLNVPLGLLFAWVLTRYEFPGRHILDALIDLPVVLPTVALGLALTSLYATTGWLGAPLAAIGAPIAFTPAGVTLALTVIGLPFVVRTIAPVLSATAIDAEEASAVLGATRWQTFRHVTLPAIAPALVTGAALAFARALGEYGSVVFIAGNMPFRTEIAPLLIMTHIEEFDDAGAAAIAAVLLVSSFGLLLLVNRLQRQTAARAGLTLQPAG
jgi:sulfate transport system permease protein